MHAKREHTKYIIHNTLSNPFIFSLAGIVMNFLSSPNKQFNVREGIVSGLSFQLRL